MVTQILLWSNILLCPAAGIFLLLRRAYTSAFLLFVSSLFFISGLTYVNLQLLQHPEQLFLWQKYGLFFESMAIICAYYFTKTAFRDNSEIYKGRGFWISIIVALSLLTYIILTPTTELLFSPDFSDERVIFLTNPGFFVYFVLMLFLVFGLVQLERTLAGLHQVQRWNIKQTVLSSGLLLVSFALYFSHSLLYRSINMNYLGIRSVAVFIAVLLFCYASLSRHSGEKLALSRGIAHRSVVLLIVGGYLILLGLMGEGLRYFNVINAEQVFYILLLLSSIVLAVVFLSERLRRKLKVILHKNFYQSKYDYREQWQKFAERVAVKRSLPDIQVSILELFCDPLACKGAALYLQDLESDDFIYQSSFQFRRDWRPFSGTDPLIVKLKGDWIVNLRETDLELDGSLIESFADVRASLVVPLFFDNEMIGFIILGEQINPDEELNYEDYDLLRMLARQAILTIQGLRLSEQLVTTRELAAMGRVSTFVLHDLKNQVSGLSLMLDNARDYIEDPEFQQDMLETVTNTAKNMKSLIARLQNIKEKPKLVMSSNPLKKIVDDAVETAGYPVQVKGTPSVYVAVDEEEIYKVILNLLMNAAEATKDGSDVRINYGNRDGFAFVEVCDSGCGMSADFIENKLFKPFVTTKKHGFGIGLYQCKQIVESHGGKIEVASSPDKGTMFTLFLPVARKIKNS